MKSKVTFTILMTLFSLVAINVSSAQTVKTKPAEPRTVTDYFMILPSKYFYKSEKPLVVANRRELIDVEDAKNGYLRLKSDEREGRTEIALFKKKSGGYLTAVSLTTCAPQCDGEINFLEYKNGRFKEIDALPAYTFGDLLTAFHGATQRQPTEDERNQIVFELPRDGKEITLKMGGVSIMGFLWTGDEFASGMTYLRDEN